MLRRTSFLDRHIAEIAQPMADPVADVAERLGEDAVVKNAAGDVALHPFVVHCDVNGLSPRSDMLPPGGTYVLRPLTEERKAELKERLNGAVPDLKPSTRLRNYWLPQGTYLLYEDDFGNVLRWNNPLELHLPVTYGTRHGWLVLHYVNPACGRELADASLEGFVLRLDMSEGDATGISSDELLALHMLVCRQYQGCYPKLGRVLASYQLAQQAHLRQQLKAEKVGKQGHWRFLQEAGKADLNELKRTATYEGGRRDEEGEPASCWWSRPHTGVFLHLALAGHWDELLRRLREQSEANAKRAGTLSRNRVVYEAIEEVEKDGADTVRMVLKVFTCHAERKVRVHFRVEPFGRLIVKLPSLIGEYRPSAAALRHCVAYDLLQIG